MLFTRLQTRRAAPGLLGVLGVSVYALQKFPGGVVTARDVLRWQQGLLPLPHDRARISWPIGVSQSWNLLRVPASRAERRALHSTDAVISILKKLSCISETLLLAALRLRKSEICWLRHGQKKLFFIWTKTASQPLNFQAALNVNHTRPPTRAILKTCKDLTSWSWISAKTRRFESVFSSWCVAFLRDKECLT